METPPGVVITKTPVSKRNHTYNYTQDVAIKKVHTIKCFIFHKGVLYRKDSIREACEIADVVLQGYSHQKFMRLSYHTFKNRSIIFIDYEKLPANIKEKIDAVNLA